jgi:hypothetical protein
VTALQAETKTSKRLATKPARLDIQVDFLTPNSPWMPRFSLKHQYATGIIHQVNFPIFVHSEGGDLPSGLEQYAV